MSNIIADDLFAGAGGWDLGAAALGIHARGVENMKEARATRDAAGLTTIHDDVWTFAPDGKAAGLIASPPCFAAGTPVLTRRGSIGIEEVVVGDEVWTHENRWREVTATMSRESDLVQVGPITTTPDHPFYSRAVGRRWDAAARTYRRTLAAPKWLAANELKGHYLATPLSIDATPHASWPVDPWLAGRYVADGWTGRDGLMVAVGMGKDEEFKREAGASGWATSQSGPSCTRYTLADHAPAAWLREAFGHGAHEKRLPTFLYGESRHIRERFLAGYLSGDGSPIKSGHRAVTVSSHLASGLRMLAIGLGLTVNVVRVDSGPTAVIDGRTVNQAPYWAVAVVANDGRYTVDEFGHRWFKQRKEVTPAGHGTVYDITVDEDHSFVAWGYVVHNCQTFSAAGKGAGRKALDQVLEVIESGAWTSIERMRNVAATLGDERTALVLTPLHFATQYDYEWLAWEQVPTVLPVWEACAEVLRGLGWNVWTGTVQAEQYGVPQTRKRAILLASRTREVSRPRPTHSKYYPRNPSKLDEGVAKWVSMAEALGVDCTGECFQIRNNNTENAAVRSGDKPAPTLYFGQRCNFCAFEMVSNYGTGGDPKNRGRRNLCEPASTVTSKIDRNKWTHMGDVYNSNGCIRSIEEPAPTMTGSMDNGNFRWCDEANPPKSAVERIARQDLPEWAHGRPSTTIVGSFRPDVVAAPGYRTDISRQNAPNSVRVSVEEAGILQSFPVDMPWQGSKSKQFLQVGNAVPPVLAMHTLAEAIGVGL